MGWRSKPTTPRPATSTGSPFHGSGPSGPRVPTMPWTQRCGRHVGFVSTTLGVEVPVLSSLPRRNNSPLAQCGCKKHAMDFHGDHAATCTAQPKRTTGWSLSLDPCFARLDTQFGHNTGSRPAQANGAATCQLFTRPSGQPEPGLRPDHHARPLRLQQPRAAERFAIASPGPRCAFATCCAAQN